MRRDDDDDDDTAGVWGCRGLGLVREHRVERVSRAGRGGGLLSLIECLRGNTNDALSIETTTAPAAIQGSGKETRDSDRESIYGVEYAHKGEDDLRSASVRSSRGENYDVLQ